METVKHESGELRVLPKDSLQDFHRLPEPVAYELSGAEAELLNDAIDLLAGISRTFKGESNVETSDNKKVLLLEGEELSTQVEVNFYRGVQFLLSKIKSFPDSSEQLIPIFEQLVKDYLNFDLTDESHGFFRTWDMPFEGTVKKEQVEERYHKFIQDFFDRSELLTSDPVGFAAWCEYEFNSVGHFLSDGCGRTSKALGLAILINAELGYPRFESREEYFALIGKGFDEFHKAYRAKIVLE